MREDVKPVNGDEISLVEINEALRDKWAWIAGVAVLGGGIGIAVAMALPKKFEASVYLEPPRAAQYMGVNETRTSISGLPWVSSDDLYGYFLSQLRSDASKLAFFEKVYLPSLDEQPESVLAKNALYAQVIGKLVTVDEPSSKKGRPLYKVTMRAPTGDQVVQWMNAYLHQVEDAARVQWVADTQQVIDATIKNTQKEIAEKTALAVKLREDHEVRLSEALRVAKSVGQHAPQLTVGQLPKQDGVAAFSDGSSLYARGARSLGAEIDVLRAREDESAFIEGLRQAQAKLDALQEQNLSSKEIGMYRIDGQLLQPAKPVFPKKSVMAVLGVLIGMFGSVTWALVKSASVRRREGYFSQKVHSNGNANLSNGSLLPGQRSA